MRFPWFWSRILLFLLLALPIGASVLRRWSAKRQASNVMERLRPGQYTLLDTRTLWPARNGYELAWQHKDVPRLSFGTSWEYDASWNPQPDNERRMEHLLLGAEKGYQNSLVWGASLRVAGLPVRVAVRYGASSEDPRAYMTRAEVWVGGLTDENRESLMDALAKHCEEALPPDTEMEVLVVPEQLVRSTEPLWGESLALKQQGKLPALYQMNGKLSERLRDGFSRSLWLYSYRPERDGLAKTALASAQTFLERTPELAGAKLADRTWGSERLSRSSLFRTRFQVSFSHREERVAGFITLTMDLRTHQGSEWRIFRADHGPQGLKLPEEPEWQ